MRVPSAFYTVCSFKFQLQSYSFNFQYLLNQNRVTVYSIYERVKEGVKNRKWKKDMYFLLKRKRMSSSLQMLMSNWCVTICIKVHLIVAVLWTINVHAIVMTFGQGLGLGLVLDNSWYSRNIYIWFDFISFQFSAKSNSRYGQGMNLFSKVF